MKFFIEGNILALIYYLRIQKLIFLLFLVIEGIDKNEIYHFRVFPNISGILTFLNCWAKCSVAVTGFFYLPIRTCIHLLVGSHCNDNFMQIMLRKVVAKETNKFHVLHGSVTCVNCKPFIEFYPWSKTLVFQ